MRYLGLAVALAAAPAWANGRFPASTSVALQSTDPSLIMIGTTFGLVMSRDGGQTWGWSCEQSIGYGGAFDPAFAATATGTLLAGIYDRLSVSRDGGCTWTYMMLAQWSSDVEVGGDGAIWVTTSSSGKPNDVYVSRDDAVSFTPQGLPEPVAWWKDIRVAPSDPGRVYAAGYRLVPNDAGGASEPVLYRLDGTTWSKVAANIPGAPPVLRLFAIDPKNPDVLFAHVEATSERLLRSEDGGKTWDAVLEPLSQLQAFAIRPDDSLYVTGTSLDHAAEWTSTDGKVWTPAAQQPKLACLRARSDGTFLGCGGNFAPDLFALGKSTDGQSWTRTFRFNDLSGPLACPAGTPQKTMCEPQFPALAQQLGLGPVDAGVVDAPAPATPPGGKCGCGVGVALVVVPLWGRRRKS